MLRSFIVAAATAAPVFPALTIASHVPSLTRSVAMLMEEFFFLRIAIAGDSFISTTSDEWMISILLLFVFSLFNELVIWFSSPTRYNFSNDGNSSMAKQAPSTFTS